MKPYCAQVLDARIVDEGAVVTARGVTSSIDLGLYLVERLAGAEIKERIRAQMDYLEERDERQSRFEPRRIRSGEAGRASSAAAWGNRGRSDPWPAPARVPERQAAVSGRRGRRDAWPGQGNSPDSARPLGYRPRRAENEADLFFGLGYAMARSASGSWIIGDGGWSRVSLPRCSDPATFPATARCVPFGHGRGRRPSLGNRSGRRADRRRRADPPGIDRGTEEAMGNLPLEFEVLGYEPRPWNPADSIAIWKHRWWTLTGRLDLSVLADYARKTLPDLADAFFDVELSDETIVESEEYHVRGNPGAALDEGSNNWVVGGHRTTTGAHFYL